jgi:hypothetical protein
MGLQEFRTADYEPRKATVKTPIAKYPSLAPFFKNEEPQEFEIRALMGEDVYKAENRVRVNKDLPATIEALMSAFTAENIQVILKTMGLSEDVPDQKVYEVAVVQFGVTKIGEAEVQLTQEDSVKLFDNCTVVARLLYNRILNLSGMGNIPLGESNASGTTKESGTP